MPWRSGQSLRWRLAGLVGALIVALAVVLAMTLPAQLARHSERWSTSRALGVATAFATSLEAPLEFDDADSARAQIALLSELPGAVFARLARADGSTLAEWDPGQVAGASPPAPAVAAAALDVANDRILASIPMRGRGALRPRTGSFFVAFDLGELHQQQAAVRATVAVQSALVLLLGLTGALIVGTVFVRPIGRVTRVAGRIAAGDLAARSDLEMDRRDELGRMSAAVSAMVEQLLRHQSELEGNVAARTRELAAANTQLGERLAELRRAQQQLIVADRRMAVGRLALGVAHEINNPLAYVISNVQHVRELAEEASAAGEEHPGWAPAELAELQESLGDALEGAERIRRIVQKLQASSHTDDDRREAMELGPTLDTAIKMTLNEIRHRARLVTALGVTPRVEGNALQLGQVFVNLLINAAQAIVRSGEGATVTVTSHTDERGWAVVEVSDTGSGIGPDIRDRIFDPFFTTKDVGQGTGLGLTICHGIVSSHGGTLTVESAVGRGSTFTVALPPAAPSPDAPVVDAAPAPAREEAPSRRLRVLVVDDDERVVAALRRALRRELDVEVALGGGAALDLLRGGLTVDAVVCDLMMPGMTGMELHAVLAAEQPAIARRMVFISGGAFTEDAKAFAASRPGQVLAKPVEMPELLALVRRMSEEG